MQSWLHLHSLDPAAAFKPWMWVQARLFIIFGVCGLIVQTLLLRVLLSWFNESRVLVIGESS